MNTVQTKTVRDLAVEIPGATREFEKLGIDYCCGGQQSIADACAKAGITVDEMLRKLKSGKAMNVGDSNFEKMPLVQLTQHILDNHHVFTKSEIERLRALMTKVHGVHAQNHPELGRLHTLLDSLFAELEPHMMKEERVLFPYVCELERMVESKSVPARPPFGTVANPVRVMMMDHDNAGELLKEMRKVTDNYKVPEDGCFSFQTLYQAIEAFEKDLHQHIHLENNILFPRALGMEPATN